MNDNAVIYYLASPAPVAFYNGGGVYETKISCIYKMWYNKDPSLLKGAISVVFLPCFITFFLPISGNSKGDAL